MQKRYFWAIWETKGGALLYRFRNEDYRRTWFASCQPTNYIIRYVTGNDPEVRRIQRRIARGENIQFPTEV